MDFAEFPFAAAHRRLADRLLLKDAVGDGEVVVLAVDRRRVAGEFHRVIPAVERNGHRVGFDRRLFRLLLGFGLAVDFAHADRPLAHEEADALFAAARRDEDVFVGHGELVRFEHGDRGLAPLGRILVVDVERAAEGGFELQLFGGDPDHLRVRVGGGAAEVAEHHLAVPLGNFLPRPEHHVVERLLKVELAHRSDRGAEAALGDRLAHRGNHLLVLIHQSVVAEHLGVGGERAARHREERDERVDLGRLGRHEVVFQRRLDPFFELDDLLHIDVEVVLGAAQRVPHGEDVRLAGAAGERRNREVELVRPAFERGVVSQHAAPGGFVRMEDEPGVFSGQLARHADGLVNLVRGRGARGVLEADRVEGDSGVENPPQHRLVEFHRMADASRRKLHHGDGYFVFQPGVGDALPAVDQVVDVVERVEVADRGDAVLLHQLRMEFDDIARLAVEADHVDAPRQRLEIRALADDAPEIVHHPERILVAVEIGGLEERAAARLEVGDSRRGGLFDHRQEIRTEHPRPEHRLEAVAERRQHEINLFHTMHFLLEPMGETCETAWREYAGGSGIHSGITT